MISPDELERSREKLPFPATRRKLSGISKEKVAEQKRERIARNKLKKDDSLLLFSDFIKAMSLKVFINSFVFILDTLEGSPTQGQMVKMTLWSDQERLCDEYEEAIRRGDSVFLLLKARQIGGSSLFALHKIKRLVEGGSYKCVMFSANIDAARNFLAERVLPVLKNLPPSIMLDGVECKLPWPKYEDTAGTVTMEDGSFIKILAATKDAGVSYTVTEVLLDEAGKRNFLYFGESIFTSVKPLVQRSGGMITILSTPSPGSWFNRIARDIIDGNMLKASYFFASYKTDPSYTQEKYDADLSQAPDPITFRGEHPLTVEDAFLKREGAIYTDLDIRLEINGSANPKAHVGIFDPQFQMIETGWQFIIGMDLGYNHKHMILFSLYDSRNDQLMVFDEMVFEKTIDLEIAKQLRTRLAMWKSYAHQFCGLDDLPYIAIADNQIERYDRTVSEIYREHAGVSFIPADKTDELASRALTQSRVRQHKVMFSLGCTQADTSGCPVAVEQLQNVHWKVNRGSNVIVDEVADIENESYDIFRYIENYIHSQILGIVSKKPNKTQVLQAESYSIHKENHLRDLMKKMLNKNSTNNSKKGFDWETL